MFLSQGNVLSTPKTSASVSSHPMLSDKPFINPSARPTGPVVNPAEQDIKLTKTEAKSKKKSHKSSKSEKPKDTVMTDPPASAASIPGPGDDMQEPVFRPVSSAASSLTSQENTSSSPTAQAIFSVSQTGQGTMHTGTYDSITWHLTLRFLVILPVPVLGHILSKNIGIHRSTLFLMMTFLMRIILWLKRVKYLLII